MSNNIFSGNRLALLFRQHLIHNTQLLLLSAVAYLGAIFIVLCVVQIGNDFKPHDTEEFQGFLIGFVSVFGIVYTGHAFPAFRSKESAISYLMVPASVLEKFVFEFIIRIVVILVTLPLLFWATFHLQGYFFSMFIDNSFQPISLKYLVEIDVADEFRVLAYSIITAAVLLTQVVAFTGAAMFGKQPLVKTLFALAVIVTSFLGYSYIMMVHLGVEEYHPPETMFLLPLNERDALTLVCIGLIVSTVIMMFVAYRKLKEREV